MSNELKPGHCHKCGLALTENPHPEAGKPDHVLNVGCPKECIPCLTLSRHSWYTRAMKAESELRDLRAALPSDAAQAPAVPVELIGVENELKNGDGFWRSCSGCHETEDGHPVGHYEHSAILNCDLGSGCSECGGIGAVWDNTDYEDMGEFCERQMLVVEQFEEWWHEGPHPFRNVGGNKDLQLTQEMAKTIWDAARAAAPVAPASAKTHLTAEQVEQIMEQAQVFASAWSMVGGVFDHGDAFETAEAEKTNLRTMLTTIQGAAQ